MNEEEGFYKLEVGAKRSVMLFATHLENKGYTLDISLKNTYDYPVDGWTYFDTSNEACESFGVDPEEFREDLFPSDELSEIV
jgi:YHS domain-containing protein